MQQNNAPTPAKRLNATFVAKGETVIKAAQFLAADTGFLADETGGDIRKSTPENHRYREFSDAGFLRRVQFLLI